MAGLLDYLFAAQDGGLLNGSYPSPLYNKQDAPMPMYDQMGNVIGAPAVTPPDPFGSPDLTKWAQQFAPRSPFVNAPPAAVPFSAGPTMQPQKPAAQPQMTAGNGQVNDAFVDGYPMPRIGSVADYTPQAPTDVSAQSRQPQMAQPQQLPPAFGRGGEGFFDRLNNGLQSIGNGGSIIGALTGKQTDPQSISQQNLKAQYEALVPLVGPQKAMLAVMNPEAGKTILAQALEKKQYGFTKLDNDTIVANDPQTGKSAVSYGGGGEDRGTITGPDGKPIAIPPGVDRKTFVNEVSRANAKVAAGERTEVQAKSEIFANKMELSNKQISDVVGTSLAGKIASGLPLGNFVQSPAYQKYKQASSNFITALLRQESGAAINKPEFDRYDNEYMPQPGDSKEVLAQKSEARRVAIEAMKKGAGPGYKSPTAAPLPSGWSVSVR